MIIGKLRHRVAIEQNQVEIDSDGAQVEVWVNIYERQLWAECYPLSGKEFIEAGAVQSKASTRFIIRMIDGIEPNMRVVHRGKYYNIEASIPDRVSGKNMLTLLCSTGVNDG